MIRVRSLTKILPTYVRCNSTQVSSQQQETVTELHKKWTTDGTVEARESAEVEKGGARLPLVKNFFVGVVDKELLAFPEVLDRDTLSSLNKYIQPVKSYFETEVDSKAIDSVRALPATLLDNVRQLGLYGINVPKDFDGQEWNWSGSLMATEPESNCTDLALALLSHRVIVDVLNEFGTATQKRQFLEKLGKGEIIATEAIFEEDLPEDYLFKTSADYNPDTKKWVLNGEKAFVVTGPLPTNASLLMIVIAQTNRLSGREESGKSTTIFAVDTSMPGVELGEKHITLGCRGADMRKVKFNQVELSDSHIIGKPHDGNVAAESLLRSNRLRSSMLALGITKNLLNDLSQYSIETKQSGVAIKDMELTKLHLSKSLCDIYATESLIYYTAGLLDEFHGQDVQLETAITKYFSLSKLYKLASVAKDMSGPKSLHSGEIVDIALRNAAQLTTQGDSLDTLKLCIALTGLQHAGTILNETVKKSRNPLFNPGHIFSKFMQSSSIEYPKTNMRLEDNLHPTLMAAAKYIEHSVARLYMSVELLLTRHGSGVIEQHGDIARIADMASTIYAMFASASRASRSYCIGLHLADHEMLIATTICTSGRELVKLRCQEIFNGEYVNNDKNLHRLSGQIFKSKGYFPVHPLTYNF